MFISHKNNVIQQIHEAEWECRRMSKGISKSEYWVWLDSVTTVTGTPPDTKSTVDLSGETGYTIVECIDEDIQARILQLGDYVNNSREPDEALIYNIEWSDSKDTFVMTIDEGGNSVKIVESEEKDEDPESETFGDVIKTNYKMSHFSGDDTAKDARLLATEWKYIRRERDKLLTSTDWTQVSDTALTSAKVTAWATYRTKLRTLPADQSSVTTYADITWPSEP
jgi:hypothetical protein